MKQGTLLTRIVMIVLFAAILIYIAAAAAIDLLNPVRVVPAMSGVVDNSITVNGWVFRDEAVLPTATGLVNLRLDDGERVGAGKTVAVVYQSEDAMDRQQELRDLSSRIAQLDYARSEASPSGAALDTQITEKLAQLRVSSSAGDFSALADNAEEYKRLILRREYVYDGEAGAVKAEIGQASLQLTQEQESLKNAALGEYSEIISYVSGYYTGHTDGYESILQPALLDQITTGEFLALTSQEPLYLDPATLGKVVTASGWKLAVLETAQRAANFQVGQSVEVRLSTLSKEVPMTVERVSNPENDQCVVVLSSSLDLGSVLNLRGVNCSVVFDSQTGILVPKEALRVLDDLTGVYTVLTYQAEFKPVTVLAEREEYYLVAPNPQSAEDERILRAGDEVVISKDELYVGKVVR